MKKIRRAIARLCSSSILTLAVAAVLGAQLGCAASKNPSTLPGAAASVLTECGQQDSAGLASAVLTILGQVALYVIADRSIDWPVIEGKVETSGTAVLQCAFVEVIDLLRDDKKPAPPASSDGDAVASSAPVAHAARVTAAPSAWTEPSRAALALDRLKKSSGSSSWRLLSGKIVD